MSDENVFMKWASTYRTLSGILENDIALIEEQMATNNNQTCRRLYVKSIFSWIDAQLSLIRENIQLTGRVDYLGLSEQQEDILYGKQYRKNGKIKKKGQILNFENNARFTLDLFLYINYVFVKLDKKSIEWKLLKKAVKIRNRVTHPGNPSDLFITDEEMKLCQQAYFLFLKMIRDIMIAAMKPLQEYLDRIKLLISKGIFNPDQEIETTGMIPDTAN